jgi:hypothetical protein
MNRMSKPDSGGIVLSSTARSVGRKRRRSGGSASDMAASAVQPTLAATHQEFDPAYFSASYPDLAGRLTPADAEALFQTYLANVKSVRCDPNRDFSEHWYLTYNPDVKQAVANRDLLCGFDHWVKHGRTEGRISAASQVECGDTNVEPAHLKQMFASFDPQFVREKCAKALHLPASADDARVFQAYLDNVRKMQLDPNERFVESFYLEQNSDVGDSVKAGSYHCGFHHWIAYGRREGRVFRRLEEEPEVNLRQTDVDHDPSAAFAALFDGVYYAEKYIDCGEAPAADAFRYFMHTGLGQGHVPVPPERFDESFYLSYYVDVADAKQRGDVPSGYCHFVLTGRGEGRCPTYDAGRLLESKVGDAAKPVALSHIDVISDRLAPIAMHIDNTRPATLNIFVPTLDRDMMFGGYTAFLNFLCRVIESGYRVRFLIMEDVYGNRDWFLRNLADRPRWFNAFHDAEISNCTGKSATIGFNSADICVAYSTWTMHDAWSVASRLDKRSVLFFIQEYEPDCHGSEASQFVSAAAYRLPHFAIFNSESLKDYFSINKIGVFAPGCERNFLAFRHALAAVSPDLAAMGRRGRPSRLFCHARPERHAGRNLLEICVLALRDALRDGMFTGNWTFHGFGSLGHDYELDLGGGHRMTIEARIAQDKYETLLRSFDVGLSLMWGPHPSIIPFELARAGVVTVTNEYGSRTQRKLAKFGYNIVGAVPTIDGIAAALGVAAERSKDLQARLQGAAFDWPVSWDEVFDDRFIAAVSKGFGIQAACKR